MAETPTRRFVSRAAKGSPSFINKFYPLMKENSIDGPLFNLMDQQELAWLGMSSDEMMRLKASAAVEARQATLENSVAAPRTMEGTHHQPPFTPIIPSGPPCNKNESTFQSNTLAPLQERFSPSKVRMGHLQSPPLATLQPANQKEDHSITTGKDLEKKESTMTTPAEHGFATQQLPLRTTHLQAVVASSHDGSRKRKEPHEKESIFFQPVGDTKAKPNKKKAHDATDYAGLLEKIPLTLVIRFASDSAKATALFRQVNKHFKTTLDSALYWNEEDTTTNAVADVQTPLPKGIIPDIVASNGHSDLVRCWGDVTYTPTLADLGFYEAAVAESLFVKKPVPGHNKNIPKSVSRMLLLTSLAQNFPGVQAAWENGRKGMMHAIVTYMVWVNVIPDPNEIDLREHCKIVMGNGKYSKHTIYYKYRSTVPSNAHAMFDMGINVFNSLPLELRFLLVGKGNKYRRW